MAERRAGCAVNSLLVSAAGAPRDEPNATFTMAEWTDLTPSVAAGLVGSAADEVGRISRVRAVAEAIERRFMYEHHLLDPEAYPPSSLGWAAGTSQEDAHLRATLEVIERRSYELLLGGEACIQRLDLSAVGKFKQYRLKLSGFRILPPVRAAVVGVAVVDTTVGGPQATFGLGAGQSLVDATAAAIREALKARMWAYSIRQAEDTDASIERLRQYASPNGTDRFAHFMESLRSCSPPSHQEVSLTDALKELGLSVNHASLIPEATLRVPIRCPVAFLNHEPRIAVPHVTKLVFRGEPLLNPLA